MTGHPAKNELRLYKDKFTGSMSYSLVLEWMSDNLYMSAATAKLHRTYLLVFCSIAALIIILTPDFNL